MTLVVSSVIYFCVFQNCVSSGHGHHTSGW